MGIEAATYLDDLVDTNPVGASDAVATLDNHIRLLKTVLQNTFPNIDAAVNPTPAELNKLAGLTALAADLELLSGAAAAGLSAAELLYVNGVTSAIQTQLDGKQPLDSDLTAIAALATTSYGRSLLEAASASAARTLLGLVIGTDVQAFDSDLASIAALSTTSYGRGLLTTADAAALRTALALPVVYAGMVDVSANTFLSQTANTSGWSVSVSGSRVTHNLGLADPKTLVIMITTATTSPKIVSVNPQANYFDVYMENDAGAGSYNDYYFVAHDITAID